MNERLALLRMFLLARLVGSITYMHGVSTL
jgi:hypothetical protein